VVGPTVCGQAQGAEQEDCPVTGSPTAGLATASSWTGRTQNGHTAPLSICVLPALPCLSHTEGLVIPHLWDPLPCLNRNDAGVINLPYFKLLCISPTLFSARIVAYVTPQAEGMDPPTS
jgi:hypothetical protein